MTTTRTLSAAEAANSPELWTAVERGEVKVTYESYGRERDCSELWLDASGEFIALQSEYDWQPDNSVEDFVEPGTVFTITDIASVDQSPNSPAAVERLNARIAELEADNERLRGYIDLCAEKFGGAELPFDPTDTGLFKAINPEAE